MASQRGFERQDYYRILQVDPGAHPEIVRAAYRTLLRVLGKHPDHGGETGEARNIIEAYSTLSVPERRHAYDQWLRAHSVVPPAPVVRRPFHLPHELAERIRAALPDYRDAPDAPFARNFDLVLEGFALTAPRVYVKAYASISRRRWPVLLTLCRAVVLARRGLLPTTDLVLFVGGRLEELAALLGEARFHSAPFRWHRHVIAVASLEPPALHVSLAGPVPRVLSRLRTAFAPP
jgi:hypothetical protein